MATAYSLRLWADILTRDGRDGGHFAEAAERFRAAVNTHLWDGAWYGRGITDDDVIFGVKADPEGRIYLNAQSWAFLGGVADEIKKPLMIKAVEEQLETPYGVEMLAPAYTRMREDVGRLTQKFPGVAENGSVYNHAAIFYIYSLYQVGEADKAYDLIRRMLTGPDEEDLLRRGQLPVFVPNYYRGAHRQFPEASGRSSHLFNTGTVSWLYRSIIEGLLGLKGCREGLCIQPQLPSHWEGARAVRHFRGAELRINIQRDSSVSEVRVTCNGKPLSDTVVRGVTSGQVYDISVVTP